MGDAEAFQSCALGLSTCHDEAPCPLHTQWAPIKKRILEMLEDKSLAELAGELTAGRASIDVAASGRAR